MKNGWLSLNVEPGGRIAASAVQAAVKRKGRHQPEEDLHIVCADFLRTALDDTQTVWLHTPNGGKRHIVDAAKLERMGTLAGMPDFTFYRKAQPWARPFCIELKSATGTLSEAQRKLHPLLIAVGCRVEVARSFGQFVGHIREFGLPLRVTEDWIAYQLRLKSAVEQTSASRRAMGIARRAG